MILFGETSRRFPTILRLTCDYNSNTSITMSHRFFFCDATFSHENMPGFNSKKSDITKLGARWGAFIPWRRTSFVETL